jgi:Putative amidase domain
MSEENPLVNVLTSRLRPRSWRAIVALIVAIAIVGAALGLRTSGALSSAAAGHRTAIQTIDDTASTTNTSAGAAIASGSTAATPQCMKGYQPESGYSLDVCIAVNGTTVTPSVNVRTIGNTGTNCSIALETWDDAGNRLDSGGSGNEFPCNPGPATGGPLDLSMLQNRTVHASPDGSLTVHTFARLYVNGQGVYRPGQGDSPSVTVQTSGTSSGQTAPSSGQTGAFCPPGTFRALPCAPGTNKYNAAGAAAWAITNLHSTGDWYPDDCTDFVSTVMWKGGGLPMTLASADHRDDHSWWMATNGVASRTWTSAPDLQTYLSTSGRGTQVSLQNAKPGDVIFANWHDPRAGKKPGLGIDHAAMIVGNPGAAGNYNVKIAQHSGDKIETLADWRAAFPHLQVWVYSISSS